uniref:Uncharacterized protein n=1 Tax=Lepeophtheirus salmonis TaxID=72036 RepID=A0A0K2V2W2_LEPSM
MEGFNSVWNTTLCRNESLWSVITPIRDEDGLERQKWRYEISSARINDDGIEGLSRRTRIRDKQRKISNICAKSNDMKLRTKKNIYHFWADYM